MSKCSFCGGEIVDHRCTDCGMPYYNEKKYTLRSERPGERAHTHDGSGEPVPHRVREMPGRPAYAPRPDKTERPRRGRGDAPLPRDQELKKAKVQRGVRQIITWVILIVVLAQALPVLLVSCSA